MTNSRHSVSTDKPKNENKTRYRNLSESVRQNSTIGTPDLVASEDSRSNKKNIKNSYQEETDRLAKFVFAGFFGVFVFIILAFVVYHRYFRNDF